MLHRSNLHSQEDDIELNREAINLIRLESSQTRNSPQNVYAVRDGFKTYFNGVGAVEWQWEQAEINS